MRELRIVDDRGGRVTGFGTKVFRELTGERFVTLRGSDLSQLLFEKLKGATEVIFGDEIVGLKGGKENKADPIVRRVRENAVTRVVAQLHPLVVRKYLAGDAILRGGDAMGCPQLVDQDVILKCAQMNKGALQYGSSDF